MNRTHHGIIESDKPSVSVVIPTFNRAKYIIRAIDSVLSQTYSNFEIIIVDDGSTDDTRRILQPYFEQIKYIYQTNAGPASARNRGVATARGDWLAFLDSDDVWLPEKLQTQLRESVRLKADLCFHDLSFQGHADKNPIVSWNRYIHGETPGREPLKTNILLDAYSRMMTTGHLFITTTFFVRRSAVLEVGGFRPSLRTSEDLDLYFRLAARYRVAYVAEALAIYSPGTGRLTDKELIYKDRIQAIRLAISDRLQSGDHERAELGKTGMLQEVRSLAGEYRRSSLLVRSLITYFYWLALLFIPVQWIGYKGELRNM